MTRQRRLATVSLAAGGMFVAGVVVFFFRNALDVIIGLVAVAITIGGAWWLVTERMPRRAFGIAGLTVGVIALVAIAIDTFADVDQIVARLVLIFGLLAVATASARAALADELHEAIPAIMRPGPRPQHPVMLCNPWSGGGKVQRFGVVEVASSLGIETVLLDHGLDLEKLARDAVARGADCLGMAGGDGSQALVASIAVEHDLPFVCVPAGTRNHFALDLGLDPDDPVPSMYAFRDAVVRQVDYGTVNDRFFVNNVSLGAYATIVQHEHYREAKVDTSKALLPEILGRTPRPFDLQFTTPDDNEVDRAFVILVSNNPYVLGPSLDVSQRRRIDTGRLGVFAVTAATGAQAAQVVTLALAGQVGLSTHAYQFTTTSFEVRSRSGTAYAGIDGEALELDTPLRFTIHPGGLRLLVPRDNPDAAIRRAARDADLADLVAIVRGRAPRSARLPQ